MDGIIGNGIGGTPHVERSDMVRGIFTSKAFKLRNVRGELGGHRRPTNIMVDGVIDQMIEIGETEACHVREQGYSRGSSCRGSIGSISGIRAGVTTNVRPRTRHSDGDRGRTNGTRRTQ